MNILMLVKNFDLGGTEVHVRELTNQLYNLGHKIHVVSNTGRQVNALNKGIIHHNLKFSEFKTPFRIYQLSKLIRKYEIDIIHGHQRIPITYAALLGKLTRIPSIATVHGRLNHDIRSKFIRNMLNHIIAVAPNRLHSLAPDSTILAKSSVIYNAVKQGKLGSKTNRKPIISYVARMDRKHTNVVKNLINETLPVLSQLSLNNELHVVGDGPHLQSLIQQYEALPPDNKPNVIFHGYHPNPQDIISRSILNLGVGRVAIEALSVNTPVISVNAEYCGGLINSDNYQDLKENNFVARTFDSYSSKLLTNQVIEFMQNKQATDMTIFERVRHEFSYSTMTNQIEKLYQQYG